MSMTFELSLMAKATRIGRPSGGRGDPAEARVRAPVAPFAALLAGASSAHPTRAVRARTAAKAVRVTPGIVARAIALVLNRRNAMERRCRTGCPDVEMSRRRSCAATARRPE